MLAGSLLIIWEAELTCIILVRHGDYDRAGFLALARPGGENVLVSELVDYSRIRKKKVASILKPYLIHFGFIF